MALDRVLSMTLKNSRTKMSLMKSPLSNHRRQPLSAKLKMLDTRSPKPRT